MKTKIGFLILGLGMIMTLSCTKYPPSSERLLEDLAVITQYDTSVDFNQYKTYAIPNFVVKITAKDTTNDTGTASLAVIAQIKKNMADRGFTEVAATANPDFGLQVIYYQNTTIYAYYGGYYGYNWWGYYYPYYPVYYSSYTTGLCSMELIDLKVLPPNPNQRYLRWNGYIRGLMTGNHTLDEIKRSIDQAYIQTPQLKTTAN
jgi:hypothetical protein